jgi:hypothetical protein
MSEPVAWMIRLYDISAVGYHDKVSLTRDPVLEDRERFEWIPLYAEPSGMSGQVEFPVPLAQQEGLRRALERDGPELMREIIEAQRAYYVADPPDVAALRAEIERLSGALSAAQQVGAEAEAQARHWDACHTTSVRELARAIERIGNLEKLGAASGDALGRLQRRAESAKREVAELRAKMEPKEGLHVGALAISSDPRYAGWVFVRHVDGTNWTTGAKLTQETWSMAHAYLAEKP